MEYVTAPLPSADTRLRLGASPYWVFLLLATHVRQQPLPQHWNLGSSNADSDYLDRNCYQLLIFKATAPYYCEPCSRHVSYLSRTLTSFVVGLRRSLHPSEAGSFVQQSLVIVEAIFEAVAYA